MKFLCVCMGGNVRSASLAYNLKIVGQDALTCGLLLNSEQTRTMLYEWADYIIIMQSIFKEKIPEKYYNKIRVVDVGEDTYGTPMHPELFKYLSTVVAQWKERNWII